MNFKKDISEEDIEKLRNTQLKDLFKKVPDIMRSRLIHAFSAVGVYTFGDLIDYKVIPITEIYGIGELATEYIIETLEKNGVEYTLEELGIEDENDQIDYLVSKMKDGTATLKDMRYLGLDNQMHRALTTSKIRTLGDLLKRVEYEEDFELIWGITSNSKSSIINFLAQFGITFPSYKNIEWNDKTPIRILKLPERLYNFLMRQGIDTLGKLKERKMSSSVLYDLARKKEPNDEAIKIIEKLEESGFLNSTERGALLVELKNDVNYYNDGMHELAVPKKIRQHAKTILQDMELQETEPTDYNKIQSILEYMNDCTERLKYKSNDRRLYLRSSADIIESGERYDDVESAILFADLARATKIPTVLVNALDINQGKRFNENPKVGLDKGIVFAAVHIQGSDGKMGWYIINPDKEVSEEKRVKIAKFDPNNRRLGNYYIYAFVRDINDINYHGKKGNTTENRKRIQEFVWQDLPEGTKRSFETGNPDPTDNGGEIEME